ncbi:MAG: Uma2 family endonuclease [Microcoleus sp. PH2017_01_SCD_O_A]|uniref:Uma2 family endonuclease n=1 Tax=unclassified Microcoleus TaxID=2642155 RepID=UPI001DC13714|nr:MULTISPECIES: Uma2 family endonuclease [unclassified Microcoleus]MCC3432852.1 Uma2 family endonuclease [Microcoleus sp. PH2017_04_SCI_O_A]TAE07118.1 MAG: Uma2 family endonuclease [Oscillatoriales cyanobacterium]MCC3427336.1 Uma2 family endonuclease [Microcoleus sp. PH2017_01_SCD_O_A]MCC3438943.1 Uma2 family endonuclease [Microcoleus sp. PH2017_05_CCC_O_A]MCC3592237.1 Uma2 family endonuclease [Microcoleus sp. PH2017_28_MFU_U_A]
MVISKNNFYISPEEYLEGERVSPIKHEYRRGHVYAMTGAKNPHTIIASNLIRLLGNHLLNTPCLVLTSDVKVRLEEANCYYYPDVAVTCDERDTSSTEDSILYPSLIIEVLSPSTASFDRGDKFADYQTTSSLQEYVLITQSEIQIECFRLNGEGNWVSQIYRQGDELELTSINFRCPIAQIYQKVPGII